MALKAYSVAKDGAKYISKNFRVREFRCQDGSDPVFIDDDLVAILQQIRDHFGKAVTITSAYRTASHNKKVSGATYSQHLYGTAADIKVSGVAASVVADYAEALLATSGGVGRYSTWTHVDVREVKTRWNG